MADIDRAFTIDNGLSIDDVVGIFQSANDPTVSGEAAPVGSLLLRSNGMLYQKSGLTDTEWTLTYTLTSEDLAPIVLSQYRHSGNVVQNISTAFVTILFEEVEHDHGGFFTYSNGVFTCNITGHYIFFNECSATAEGNQRTSSEWQLFSNGQPVPGTLSYGTHINFDEGKGTVTNSMHIDLSVNDTVEIRGRGMQQGIVTVANGSRMLINKVT